MADGLTPVSKQIDSDALSVAMQTIGSNPQIASSYNMGPAFSYLMKIQGADLKPFEKSPQQVAYEQASNQWQAAMQTVAETAAKLNEPLDPKMFPPQPLPEQFGYVPGSAPQKQPDANAPTILQQVVAATQQPATPMTQQPPGVI